MHVRRWMMLVFAPVVLTALPACVTNGPLLPLRPKVEPFVPPPVKTTAGKTRPNAGQFASLNGMKPGESVALNPVVAESHHPLVAIENDPPADAVPTVKGPPDPLPPLDAEPMTPLVFAIRAFQDNQPDKAVEHLKEYDKANQELLLQLIPAVVQASKANLGKLDTDDATNLAKQFEAAAATVLKRTGFGIRKAVVCLAVDGFGVYLPVPDPTALRRGSLYSVYLELDNVPSLPEVREEDGAKGFRVRLECEMRVTDEFGQTVEIQDVKSRTIGPKSTSLKKDFTRSPVRDYFLPAVLQTPTRPGVYTVTFEIRDPRTGRSVSKTIPFRVQ
jgi:hypothetical protein